MPGRIRNHPYAVKAAKIGCDAIGLDGFEAAGSDHGPGRGDYPGSIFTTKLIFLCLTEFRNPRIHDLELDADTVSTGFFCLV